MFKKSSIGLALSLLLASSASNAAIWTTTDGDSTFSDISILTFPPAASTAVFGIFEDTASSTNPAPTLTFIGASTIKFTQNGFNWDIINTNDLSNGTLLGSNNFQIGFLSNGSWVFETASAQVPGANNSWILAFGQGQGNLKLMAANDIAPGRLEADFPVPLPASVWMMGSALIGLVGVGRRKKNA